MNKKIAKQFRRKVVFITGAAAGIGKALSELFGSMGSTVIVTDINIEEAQSIADSITKAKGSGKGFAYQLDVTNEAEFESVVKKVVSDHKTLDYMVNNAGITIMAEMRDLTSELLNQVLDVNLHGVITGSRLAYNIMAGQKKGGHIVNVSSLAGMMHGAVLNIPYGISKQGIMSLTQSLHYEGEALGLKASVACPGFVETNIYDTSPMYFYDQKVPFNKEAVKNIKMMSAEDAAKIIVKGVAKNKVVIAFPFGWKFFIHLGNMFKSLYRGGSRKRLEKFRKLREEHKPA